LILETGFEIVQLASEIFFVNPHAGGSSSDVGYEEVLKGLQIGD
jgi:hypothetical protein